MLGQARQIFCYPGAINTDIGQANISELGQTTSANEALPTAGVSARVVSSHAVNCLTECLLLNHAAWYHVQLCNGLAFLITKHVYWRL